MTSRARRNTNDILSRYFCGGRFLRRCRPRQPTVQEGFSMAKMADRADVKIGVAAPPQDEFAEQFSPRMRIGSVLGPLVGLALWFIPMQVEPVAHHTLAIVAFMI